MFEIGATLRTAREQRGVSIDDAAEATKIRSSYLVALEEEQERRLILAKDYISSREAGEAMRELAATMVNRLDKLALDVAEGCNPENPAKAVKVLEAWVRRVKAELSSADEQG